MLKINYEKALEVFQDYVNLQRCFTYIPNDKDALKKRTGIDNKYIHSLEVVGDGQRIIKDLKFNESVISFSKLAFLDHDIGRFQQITLTGNFNDHDLENKLGIKNHGELGKQVLEKGILKEQIPDTRIFDEAITTIVKNHVTGLSTNEQLQILGSDILKNEDIYEIFKNGDLKTKHDIVIAMTQIVQDVDRLDIYHQILSNRWSPTKSEFDVPKEVLDMFYKGKYLNIAELRKQGLWNDNVGELVRLSFINQMRLYSVAKLILDEDIIMKLKRKRNNDKVNEAFDYTQELLKSMLDNSEDGITIKKLTKNN